MIKNPKPKNIGFVTEYGAMVNHDAAEATIVRRYPEAGYAINHHCDMIVRVVGGSGALVSAGTTLELQVGSVVFIEKETRYYYDGSDLKIFMTSSPAWTPEQYEVVA